MEEVAKARRGVSALFFLAGGALKPHRVSNMNLNMLSGDVEGSE